MPMRKRKRKLPKFNDFKPETDLSNPIFKLGLRFSSVYVFRKAVINYSIFNRKNIKFSKNDKDKIRAVCDGTKNGKYPWFVYASAVNGSSMVQINSYEEEHTCGIVERKVHANSSWLAERYATQLSRIINWDVGAFKERVNEGLCVISSRSQIYRVRQKTIAVSEGTYTKYFEYLWDYVEELKRINVGITIKIKSNFEGDKSKFERIYICLAATKKWFIDALRLVVGLYACHIKGQHPGQLLSTVGVDPNNDMYPIAYAVAEAENYATWSWFLELFEVYLGIENNNGYVFITDRQKGLIDAVGDMFPNYEHRHCFKHLYVNFILAGHRGLVLKQHMEAAARSTTIPWFQVKMKKLQDLSGPTFDWLARLDPMQWCRSHFRTHSKCDIILNNMCEAFNRSILDARDKPIITMLERIRYYIMLLMASKSETMEKWAYDVGQEFLQLLRSLRSS
ncbi:PREDICTED: uncharacterized protein LOC103321711 [Prunus mume]|uniref:Uncharacterized protein LOC103321711 n=1 Tax=Prunus mume TaxID=102107 RepID=A0ABM0NA89_PRUMU|nr:PREDICTED: uncharacterized protein LOC103321711 [Prunus mume]